MREVVCVRTGTANLASVAAAFERLGVGVRFTESRDEVRETARVVLPGVGAFGAGMARLRTLGLVDAIRERVEGGRAFLGVCLGLQLLCGASEESVGVEGLGVIPGTVTRFPPAVRVPQLGWNRIEADPACVVLRSGTAYFANSYRLRAVPAGWAGAVGEHGGSFVGGLERGAVVLCQFHPELSGAFGASVLSRWCEVSEGVAC